MLSFPADTTPEWGLSPLEPNADCFKISLFKTNKQRSLFSVGPEQGGLGRRGGRQQCRTPLSAFQSELSPRGSGLPRGCGALSSRGSSTRGWIFGEVLSAGGGGGLQCWWEMRPADSHPQRMVSSVFPQALGEGEIPSGLVWGRGSSLLPQILKAKSLRPRKNLDLETRPARAQVPVAQQLCDLGRVTQPL